jgi:hypothetical protein
VQDDALLTYLVEKIEYFSVPAYAVNRYQRRRLGRTFEDGAEHSRLQLGRSSSVEPDFAYEIAVL